MAILERIWVIKTTSTKNNAETDEEFSLEIQSQGQIQTLKFPDLSHNEREKGRTDEYEFDLRNYEFDDEQLMPGEIRLLIHGNNAWLPQSIWIIGKNVEGNFKLIVARPDWPENAWFSTDSSEGQTSRPLDQP